MEAIIREACRSWLAETGQSINALARNVQMDEGNFSRWLRGQRTLTLPTADRFVRFLGLELRKKGD